MTSADQQSDEGHRQMTGGGRSPTLRSSRGGPSRVRATPGSRRARRPAATARGSTIAVVLDREDRRDPAPRTRRSPPRHDGPTRSRPWRRRSAVDLPVAQRPIGAANYQELVARTTTPIVTSARVVTRVARESRWKRVCRCSHDAIRRTSPRGSATQGAASTAPIGR